MAKFSYQQHDKSSTGFSLAIPKKMSLISYGVTLILAVIFRSSQLLHNVNFNTGRYIDDNPIKNLPVAIIIIGTICTSVILLFGRSKDKVIKSCIMINPWRLRYDRLNKQISSKAGYASLLMCLLIIIEVLMDFATTISYNRLVRDDLPTELARDYSLLTGITVIDWLIFFTMFLAFLTFLSIAINIFKGSGISRANCAALTTFAAWKVLEIYQMFVTNSVIAVSSEKVYILLSNMAATMFFLFTARFFCGFEKKTTRFFMCFMGYLASILSAVSVIPRYVMLLTAEGYDDRLNMAVPKVSDIGMAFTTIAIVAVFWSAYAYRTMPRRVGSCKRWTINTRPKDTSMKSLDLPDQEVKPAQKKL